MMPADYELLRIVWLDIVSDQGWKDPDEYVPHEPLECVSVGFLIERTPGHYAIAQSVGGVGGPNMQVADVTTIPVGCIQTVETLAVV
jgi:hypothetical protein